MSQLFLDMDGVLADFDTGYGDRFGAKADKTADNVDWNLVRETANFYRDLPPMPDLAELWDYAKPLKPIVLTGVPISVDEAVANKRAWVDKHLGTDVPMIGCLSKEKYLHGQPGDVLVDDWEKHQKAWLTMGGVWITHTSAVTTIERLNTLF